MAWTDQNPPATNVLLSARLARNNGRELWFEIDKLDDKQFRLTVGNLFGSKEIIRHNNLETVLREVEGLR